MRPLRRSLIATIAVAIATAGCSSSHTTRAASASVTTTTNTGGVTLPRRPATRLTAEQLDAHLGVGVPAGWSPVDDGKARLWVPDSWPIESQGVCIGGKSETGVVGIGQLPEAGCKPATEWPIPAQAVGLYPAPIHGTPSVIVSTVHGYDIYQASSPSGYNSWRFYDIAQLGVQIATHGTLGSRVLHTLAPSARAVALDPTYESVANAWHAVTEHGVSLSIPLSWGVATRDVFCEGPVVVSELAFIQPNIESPRCLPRIPTAASTLIGGVSLYLPPHNPYAPNRHRHALATIPSGTTTITIYAEPNDPNVLDLFVRKTGSTITHVLTLGLGRDGRVAGGVIASIRAVT